MRHGLLNFLKRNPSEDALFSSMFRKLEPAVLYLCTNGIYEIHGAKR